MATDNNIIIHGARENNLKNIDTIIPKNSLVVVTGPSGSGKSSLVFDTIYAEGQRRYLESLSSYARQFLNIHDKPDFDEIKGLAPTIAINQKTTSNNPRSTVGTITEIYDYMRLLFARVGVLYSPNTGKPIKKHSTSQIIDTVIKAFSGQRIMILGPLVVHEKGEHTKVIDRVRKMGFQRVKIDGLVYTMDEIPKIDKTKFHDIDVITDRLIISEEEAERIAQSVETTSKMTNGLVNIETVPSNDQAPTIHKYCEKFICPDTGFSLPEIEPRNFSFNNSMNNCPTCSGTGVSPSFDEQLIVPFDFQAIEETVYKLLDHEFIEPQNLIDPINDALKNTSFNIKSRWSDLVMHPQIREMLIYGTNSSSFIGIIPFLESMVATGKDCNLNRFKSSIRCKSCNGYRLGKDILNVKIAGVHIGQVAEMTVVDAIDWFSKLNDKLGKEEKQIAEKIIKEISARLSFLLNVGLDYLVINRAAGGLSGGESQRIRLASQIGSALSGVIYVLDEPSIGLHQSDNDRLIDTLKKLRDLDNSVLVVEHDEDTMRVADYLIDMGPGAGENGGYITAAGTPAEVAENEESLTGRYLSGREKIEVPKVRRQINPNKMIRLYGASAHNLQDIDADFPLNMMVCVTGVSGSGKSTLVFDTLQQILARTFERVNSSPGKYRKIEGLENIDKFIEIDQSPIGRTPRSNPVTYTGIFDLIRDMFAGLPDSKARGYKVGRFSFNVTGGRCETCSGDGCKKIEMHFLPDVYIPCEECHGKRYNRETLEIYYKDKNIADVLAMSIDDSVKFFSAHPLILEKLKTLQDVGLGYLRLGQSVTTLSGGESQRIKLAKELSKRSTNKTIYFLDEPTTGLHSADIKNLLVVLNRLVDNGASMIIIEHNLDVIKCCDHVIDIGPGGGKNGGNLLCFGTPEDIANCKESLTGKYLRKLL